MLCHNHYKNGFIDTALTKTLISMMQVGHVANNLLCSLICPGLADSFVSTPSIASARSVRVTLLGGNDHE